MREPIHDMRLYLCLPLDFGPGLCFMLRGYIHQIQSVRELIPLSCIELQELWTSSTSELVTFARRLLGPCVVCAISMEAFHSSSWTSRMAATVQVRASTRASAVPVPRSRKDAVQDASTCLKQALKPRKGGKRGSTTRSRTGRRLVVELPVAQDGASDLAEIAASLLRDCAPSRDACLLFEDLEAVESARRSVSERDVDLCTYASDMERTSKDEAQLHVAMSPDACFDAWLLARPNCDVVALNPRLQDEQMQALGFQVAYSFMPVSAKAFGVGATIEAAVVKRSGRGPIASYPYEMYVKRDGTYECVATWKSRPTEKQLEDELYAEASRGGLASTAKRIFQGWMRSKSNE